MLSIRKILVANRGEIARRVIRTCRSMGISTVAVYSDADASMPFVREADEAVRIGPAPSTESYLNIGAILEAASRTGADAIHPGYGFLAENAEFAEACAKANVIFIGPTADAIRSMGSKQRAKALVKDAGVPVIPGYDGADQDPAVLAARAKEIGFPVLMKASAGGGGKGMKLVRKDSELEEAIASARREAEGSFGDGTLLVEKYIDEPRHVEIQILGDTHGTVVHLNERECSIQRRHQKIIEESPSPALDEKLRNQMGEAAIRCAEAIGYSNAGTVEFILGPDGQFYFLEVNTRLQVEHPVTEEVTRVGEGETPIDLVEQQVRVARGEPLAFAQEDVRQHGSSVEVRIYAEDPDAGFLPQSGRVVDWYLPEIEGVRVDDGIEAGSEVSIYYDPMLAKIISWGPDRAAAIQRMSRALEALSVQGVTTNRAFLLDVLNLDAFLSGDTHTHFIDTHADALRSERADASSDRAAIAATLADHARRASGRVVLPRVPLGWRNNYHTPQWVEYQASDDATVRVEYRHMGRNHFDLSVNGTQYDVQIVSWDDPNMTLVVAGHRVSARIIKKGDAHYVHSLGESISLAELPRFPDKSAQIPAGGCIAPMPGKIVEVRVEAGATVSAGDVLMIMEAMKMEHMVAAPHDGTVEEIFVASGQQVDADALLAVVSES